MPSIDKSDRRERKRKKAIDSKFQNVRYRTLRAGESLVRKEAERKTFVEGQRVKRVKKK